jgi:hypothetical protein
MNQMRAASAPCLLYRRRTFKELRRVAKPSRLAADAAIS